MNYVEAFVVEARRNGEGDVLGGLSYSTQIVLCAWKYPSPEVVSLLGMYRLVFASWSEDDTMIVFSLPLLLTYLARVLL